MLSCPRACAILCALLPAWGLPVFQVQAAGPAGLNSSATAINATGAVVGSYQQPDGTYRGFLWRDGQVTTLGLPAGAAQAWAAAISGAGQAGGYTDSQTGSQGQIWDNFGSPLAMVGAYIMGLNDIGDAAGMAIASDGSGYAFVTRNGVVNGLGQPGGGDWSSANAVNGAGAAAGTAMNASGSFNAFSASADGGILLLRALGGANSYATAINSKGSVAGHAQMVSGALNAAVWSGASALGLGTLGGINSYAYAINAAGQVAGYSDLAGDGGTAAFLLDDGILYNINGLIGSNSGWQLLAAYGMNESGQIVGRGIYDGKEQAFLLTPNAPPRANAAAADSAVPEPMSILLVGVPLLAYFALRQRRRF